MDTLLLKISLLAIAALPAISPITDQKVETEWVNVDTRLEANAKVMIRHLVESAVGVKDCNVASDGEEKVVIIRRKLGEFVFEHLRRFSGVTACSLDL